MLPYSTQRYTVALLLSLSVLIALPWHAQATERVDKSSVTYPLAATKVLHFSGYDWVVSDYSGGPGPNVFRPANVWVDAQGYLHLRITQRNGQWYCAGLNSVERFGYGTYQFKVISRLDRFDPNTVLGLFNYPTPDVGEDGTHEMDIEFAQWGNPNNPRGNYTLWPVTAGATADSHTYPVKLSGSYTTHRFKRSRKQVYFQSLHGHQDGNLYPFASWRYQPTDYAAHISTQAMPVFMNLWLNQGQAPQNGKPVEVVISEFKFTPLAP